MLRFFQLGVEDKDIGRVLVKYPWIISTSIQENIEEIYTLFDREKVKIIFHFTKMLTNKIGAPPLLSTFHQPRGKLIC